MNRDFLGIGTVTITIDKPNCLGHPLIWPHKEEILSELIETINSSLLKECGYEFKATIALIEPGCIKVKLELAVALIAGSAFLTGFAVRDTITSALNEHHIETPISKHKCTARVMNFSQRGLCHGPIKKGETLSGIVEKLNPKGLTLNRAMMALFSHNKDSFDNGNINDLREGAYLSLPTSPGFLSSRQADEQVAIHNKKHIEM